MLELLPVPAVLLFRLVLAGGWLVLAGCKTAPETDNPPVESVGTAGEGSANESATPVVDANFLLEMDWEQARAISAKHVEVAPFFRVAASEVEVLRTAKDGRPRKVRARGRVYVELSFTDLGRVLCQEALVSDDELILRGRPMLQRGGSLIEGLDERTVFYMVGPTLRVIGRHRITNQASVLAEMESGMAPPDGSGGGSFPRAPSVNPALPAALGAWMGGPNPLLPPLTPNAVPEEIRLRMRAEAESVDVTPLPPPPSTAPAVTPKAEPPQKSQPLEDRPPLLPVPAGSQGSEPQP